MDWSSKYFSLRVAFDLYDGVIQHAVLHLHLVNKNVRLTVFMNNSLRRRQFKAPGAAPAR